MSFHKIKAKLSVIFWICHGFAMIYSQVPIEFSVDRVEGGGKYETGVREYTVWKSTNFRVSCSCTSPFLEEMSVLRYGEKLTEYQEVRLLREEFDILNGMEVNLTCHVRGLSSALDKHRLLYILQSNLAVKATEERFCTTNVGPSGYFEEDITLLCKWNSVRVRPNPISLDEETIEEYPCQSHESIKVCNLSMLKFNIYPFLEVEVTPPFFLEESNVLEFFCKSTPPRLLYWKVFGSNGVILDLDHYRTSISVDTNVTIKQYAGETTIRISEAVAGGNGIHTVVCLTYDTTISKLALARLIQPDTNVGFIISIVVLTIVIAVLIIIVVYMCINGRKNATTKNNIKQPVSPRTTNLNTNNVAYISHDEQNAITSGEREQEYTYVQ